MHIAVFEHAIDEKRDFFPAVLYVPERREIFACKARGTYSRKVAFFRNDSRAHIVVTVRNISLRPSLTRNCISSLYRRKRVSVFYASLKIVRPPVKLVRATNARPGLEILRNIKTTGGSVCALPRRAREKKLDSELN